MPLILPSNSISAGGYEVANSLRFDGADYLVRSKGASETSLTKGTFSFWIKRTNIDGDQHFIYSNTVQDTNNRGYFSWRSTEKIRIISTTNNASELVLETNQLFRDPSAWTHIVYSIDTTQSTASNRCILYVNGTRVTSFSTAIYMDQNSQCDIFEGGQTNQEYIGGITGGTSNLHSYLSEYVYIDGQALDPTSFGEFDEDSGIWKPIDVSELTFGTNGFYLDFENSGSLGADVSGNGNNFTVNNLTSIDQTTDTPTNNYSTLNPLHRGADDFTNVIFKDGNTTFDCNESGTGILPVNYSSIGMSQGKWYCEVNCIADVGTAIALGIEEGFSDVDYGGQRSTSIAYKGSNGEKRVNDTSSAYGNSFTSGDTIGIALDLDNNYVYFSKNGTWQNSGDPESGATGTGGISVVDSSSTTTGVYHFAVSDNISSGTFEVSFNFGNPAYTISSGNSDGNGMGNFEYSVPSGYYALNTKNLSEFG